MLSSYYGLGGQNAGCCGGGGAAGPKTSCTSGSGLSFYDALDTYQPETNKCEVNLEWIFFFGIKLKIRVYFFIF